jgi:hypothetical protein
MLGQTFVIREEKSTNHAHFIKGDYWLSVQTLSSTIDCARGLQVVLGLFSSRLASMHLHVVLQEPGLSETPSTYSAAVGKVVLVLPQVVLQLTSIPGHLTTQNAAELFILIPRLGKQHGSFFVLRDAELGLYA